MKKTFDFFSKQQKILVPDGIHACSLSRDLTVFPLPCLTAGKAPGFSCKLLLAYPRMLIVLNSQLFPSVNSRQPQLERAGRKNEVPDVKCPRAYDVGAIREMLYEGTLPSSSSKAVKISKTLF